MNALVLFLVVIISTSSVSCTFSKDDQKIAMVVNDNQTPTMNTMMEADIPLQIGRFQYKDGDLSTLLRPVDGTPNCVGYDVKCGPFTGWCCGELYCKNGHCAQRSDCLPSGSVCVEYEYPACCWPYECDQSGHCVTV